LLEAARKKLKATFRKWTLHRACGAEGQEMSREDCRKFLVAIAPARRPAPLWRGGPLRIAHFICSLNTGGAERQVCNAAIAQKRAGHHVRVLLRQAPVGHDAYYLPLLEAHGIPARPAGVSWSESFLRAWESRGITPETMALLPTELRRMVIDMAGDLLARPVDVLHCSLV